MTALDKVLAEVRAHLAAAAWDVAVWHSRTTDVGGPTPDERVRAALAANNSIAAATLALSQARQLLVGEIREDELARAAGADGLVTGWRDQPGSDGGAS